jgi:hypothetical protein
METRPESRVAAEAVDRILSSAEAAIAAIRGRTEQQLRGIVADLEARAAEEAAERRARMERLRAELGERAVALAGAYQAVAEQLAAVEAALAAGGPGGAGEGRAAPVSPGAAAVKVTLRERARIELAADAAPEAARPPAVQARRAEPARRRWWPPWQREAA